MAYVEHNVPQLDAAVSAARCDLVLVQFAPREVVQAVLGVEAARARVSGNGEEMFSLWSAAHPFSMAMPWSMPGCMEG